MIDGCRVGGDDGKQLVTMVDDGVVVAGLARSWNLLELGCKRAAGRGRCCVLTMDSGIRIVGIVAVVAAIGGWSVVVVRGATVF